MKFIKLSVVSALTLVLLSGCGKVDNTIEDSYFVDRDFSVQCLHGYKYIVRVVGNKSYIAPKFDPVTSLPERCDK